MLTLDSLKSVWEAMTGVGTVLMAIATFFVVLQGRRLRKDEERRHQDGLKPICILTPYDGVDPQYRRDSLLAIHDPTPSNPGFGIIEIRCALRNIGPGPALNVGIMFRFLDMGGYTTARWELSPLRTGESRAAESDPLRVPIKFGNRFNRTDFSQVVGKAWELILVYQDVFGNSYYSVHRKRPLQLDQLYKESDTSEIVAPPQPWVTFGKGQL